MMYLRIFPSLKIHLCTERRISLLICCLHFTQLRRQSVRQLVHRLQTNVETTRRGINRRNVDRVIDIALCIVQLVAFSAVGAVPAGDGGCASDAREARDAAEGRPLGHEAVDTVGAGDGGHGLAGVVVDLVVGNGDGGCSCGGCLWGWDRERGGEEEGEERDGCSELHLERRVVVL